MHYNRFVVSWYISPFACALAVMMSGVVDFAQLASSVAGRARLVVIALATQTEVTAAAHGVRARAQALAARPYVSPFGLQHHPGAGCTALDTRAAALLAVAAADRARTPLRPL